MRKWLFIVIAVVSFIAISPLSIRIGDHFFTLPFDKQFFDPVLEVCGDHVEALRLRELSSNNGALSSKDCTFQIAPERQAWVEDAVRHLQSPVPKKSSWVIHIKQLGRNRQRIQLELFGDGVAGMIYEVTDERITPVSSRLTGPSGAMYILLAQLCLWAIVCIVAWFLIKRIFRSSGTRSLR